MKKKSLPLQIGSLTLPNRIIYSPLAGCSDFPFRKMAARYRPGLMFCEMVKMEPLVRGDPNTFHLLDFSDEMHPIGAQLCGSNPKIAGRAAKIVESLGFDIIDLNCGCPVDKVTKDGSGSGLLKNPEIIGEIITEMVAAVSIPVTVKIRAGWDEEDIVAPTIAKIAKEAGAKAIAIHGRTRKQGYKGPAIWEWIAEAKQAVPGILIFGNGDVFSPQAAEEMFQQTDCDAILCSRGTMGEPWLAEDIQRHFEGKPPIPRTPKDYKQAIQRHLEYTVAYRNDRRVCLDMRRVGCWYSKKVEGCREFRYGISRVNDVNEIHTLIDQHFSYLV